MKKKLNLKPLLPYEVVKSHKLNYEVREKYVRKYGWFYLTKEVLEVLNSFIKDSKFDTIMDIGAGSGWFANTLKDNHIDLNVRALDCKEQKEAKEERTYIKRFNAIGDIVEYVDFKDWSLIEDINNKNTLITMTWIPMYEGATNFTNLLDYMSQGQVLIYQGESEGGCNGNEEFHAKLEQEFTLVKDVSEALNEYHCVFDHLNDYFAVYVKD